jgi:hypothetical protein
MAKCEDYPCCGHTPEDPCERQWYDEPGAFDTSRPGNEHALCDHENGICEVEDDFDDEEDDDGLGNATKFKWDETWGLVPDE